VAATRGKAQNQQQKGDAFVPFLRIGPFEIRPKFRCKSCSSGVASAIPFGRHRRIGRVFCDAMVTGRRGDGWYPDLAVALVEHFARHFERVGFLTGLFGRFGGDVRHVKNPIPFVCPSLKAMIWLWERSAAEIRALSRDFRLTAAVVLTNAVRGKPSFNVSVSYWAGPAIAPGPWEIFPLRPEKTAAFLQQFSAT
jgi:hypothetical protein